MTAEEIRAEASDALARFLDRRYRQVWAVHRVTGERVFLGRGEATDEMRVYARAQLMCPVPGCAVEISARGRSKRDHFFHLNPSGHGEGEGEWHLQAKALLTEWAKRQPGFAAQEEEGVPIPGTDRIRRADVMATHASGTKVAFEVEYKDYKPEHWLAKQGDYDQLELPCTWVFGHLRRYLRQPPKPADWPEDQTWDRLQWVELTEVVARAGRPVLFINPVERAVATAVQDYPPVEEAASDEDWWQYEDRVGRRLAHPDGWKEVVLVLDLIDDCRLDPEQGLVTPTMVKIEAERAQIHERALRARARSAEVAEKRRKAREAAEADERRRAAQTAEERETARSYAEQMRQRDADRWASHPLRARIVQNLGSVPAFLDMELPADRGIYAYPTHWHSQLFQDLVLGTAGKPMLGKTVKFNEVCAMVSRAGFRFHRDTSRAFAAIRDFLDHLEDEGYLDIRDRSGDFIEAVTVVADLNHRPRPRVEDRLFSNGIALHDHTRWETSSARARLQRIYPHLPPILAVAEPDELTSEMRVKPVHWHTHLYLSLIHNRVGESFTLADAVASLTRNGLARNGEDGHEAVHTFLDRMNQHGCLAFKPAGRLLDFKYTVVTDRL